MEEPERPLEGIFGHVAGLGDVPWVMAGDWNVTPEELWVPAL